MKHALKHQIVFIHGGDSFRSRSAYRIFLKKLRLDFSRYTSSKGRWSSGLDKVLGVKFQIIRPDMPNKANAQYEEWKIWFEKFIPHLNSDVILIGHSLGGIFLTKYLAENKFPKKIRATFLVAPTYGEGSFSTPRSFKRLAAQGGKIFIYHSKDDRIVPFKHLLKYRRALPNATVRVFNKKGHFLQATFPELLKDINNSAGT